MASVPTIRLSTDQEDAAQDDFQLSDIEAQGWEIRHTLRSLSALLDEPNNASDLEADVAAQGVVYLAQLATQAAHLLELIAMGKARIEQRRDILRKTAKSRAGGQRRDFLTPIISRAVTQHGDDAAVVFLALRQMAQDKPPRPPFFGVSPEGLKWTDANDEPQTLSLKALRERLRRHANTRQDT